MFAIAETSSNSALLVYEVLSGDLVMYRIGIMQLDTCENSMMCGRFANLDPRTTANPIDYEFQSSTWAMKSLKGIYQVDMTDHINWIADNIKGTGGTWFFDLSCKSVSHIVTTFFFSDPELAIQFKLTRL